MGGPGNRGAGPSRKPSPWSYVGLGLELVMPVLLGVWVGHELDRRWGTTPWLVVGGSLAGIGVGFYSFFRTVLTLGGDDGGGG